MAVQESAVLMGQQQQWGKALAARLNEMNGDKQLMGELAKIRERIVKEPSPTKQEEVYQQELQSYMAMMRGNTENQDILFGSPFDTEYYKNPDVPLPKPEAKKQEKQEETPSSTAQSGTTPAGVTSTVSDTASNPSSSSSSASTTTPPSTSAGESGVAPSSTSPTQQQATPQQQQSAQPLMPNSPVMSPEQRNALLMEAIFGQRFVDLAGRYSNKMDTWSAGHRAIAKYMPTPAPAASNNSNGAAGLKKVLSKAVGGK